MEKRNKNGTIKKGQVLNPNGRPKGSTNKTTAEIRAFFKDFIDNNAEQFKKDFEALTPAERIDTIIKLTKVVLPKNIEAEIKTTQEPQVITFVTIDHEGNRIEEKSC